MLNLANTSFRSHLLTGTGKFASPEQMRDAISASNSQIVTLALKRLKIKDTNQDPTLAYLQAMDITLLPNTAGAANAEEAIYAANLARELLQTPWLKLEIHPDQRYLLPDPVETLKAAETLVKEGFNVLPYCSADPVLCKRLEEAGCAAVMPLGAPIGSNRGLRTRDFLNIIVEQANVPVIVDAGIGSPSDACAAMELGADGVLVNTAIATARHPTDMAVAFAKAVECGRQAYLAGTASRQRHAVASSPFTTFLDTLE